MAVDTDPLSGAARGILTPDQRPRVFISSTLAEMAPERSAARRAVEDLGLIPVMFELGARPHPARSLYRAYLAQSHLFVGLYAERYGWVAPGEDVSGLEDEYLLSDALPRLVYLKTPAPNREERLDALLDRIREDDRVSYKSFSDPDELERLLRVDLAVLLGERFLLGPSSPDPVGAPHGEPLAPQQRATPLPRPLTELIGRNADVDDVTTQISSGARMITLVGPGGIGKTRVALEIARRRADEGNDVVFVALDSVRDPTAVLPTVAATLGIGLDGGVPAVDALGRALRDRNLLLALDNVEQVLACATDVSRLLESCPGLTVLATSRAPLRVRGERQIPIGPLEVPAGDQRAVDDYSAVRLFLDRAREVRPELTLDDPVDAAAIAQLTQRLEGIPLALELAAARSKTLPPAALLSRVSTALDLGGGAVDAPARQRTLRDTVAWSEELLPEEQRRLLGELAVFEAPWRLADAESVAGDDIDDVLDSVAGLVEHSLIHPAASAASEPRFGLYEAVRAYARQQIDDSSRAATERRYVTRMADVARELDAGFRSPEHARWRREFRLVWPDLRAAMDLALATKDAAALCRLSRSWVGLWMDGRAREIDDIMRRALDIADSEKPDERGDLVLSAAGLAFNLGDDDRARLLMSRLDEVRLPSEPELPGTVELYLGYLAAGEGDLAGAEDHLKQAARLLDDAGIGGGWIGAFAHSGLGSLNALKGDLDAAGREQELAGQLGRRFGNVAAELQSAVFLAAMRLQAGDATQASHLLRGAAEIVATYPFYESNAYCVEVAGGVALARGDATAAAEALGAGEALREVVGARVWPLLAAVRAGIEQDVRSAMADASFNAAVMRGRDVDLMTLAELVRSLIGDG